MIMEFAEKQVELEFIILSKVIQTEKPDAMFPLTAGS